MSVVLWLLGCGSPQQPAPEPTPEPPAAAPDPEPETERDWRLPLQARMHEQFAYATDATYYVILGDLEQVKRKGAALAALEGEPTTDAIRAAGTRVAEAADLDAAAEAVVALGQACADCHAKEGGPKATVEQVVGGGWSSDEAMQKHQWAAYLMWVGVILPSEDVFRAGVAELEHEGALPDVPDALAPLEGRVHAIAEEAAAAKDPGSRAEALARFLKTCAACHTQAGVTFDP